jgi:hypothetical protein
MNEWFFGDKRDLVKWSVLLHLAQRPRHKISLIIQVCFRTEYVFPRILLDLDGAPVPVHDDVKRHFRSLHSVERMPHDEVTIKVFCRLFDEDRGRYVGEAKDFIADWSKKPRFADKPRIVFLDPDIGLAPPAGRVKRGHLREAEVRPFWKDLNRGDVLVLYQHGDHQEDDTWVLERKGRLQGWIDDAQVHVARCERAPRDVVFYWATKED